MHHRENLVLIGFMGSGKSSVGRLAARALGFQFVDTDQLIVERTGKQISDIFATEGEESFRAMETSALEEFSDRVHYVISTGGGAVISPKNRALLRAIGFVACLNAEEDVLFERVSRNSKRPLLQTDNPRETLSKLIKVRGPLYAETAHWEMDTSSVSQAGAVEMLVEAAKEAFSWPQHH
jgi:shikimate kinase